MLASSTCLLIGVADQLPEIAKKMNTVDRLSRPLEKGTPAREILYRNVNIEIYSTSLSNASIGIPNNLVNLNKFKVPGFSEILR